MDIFFLHFVLGFERDDRVDFNAKCHGQSVSVMDSLCHRYFVSVIKISNNFLDIFRAEPGQNISDFDFNEI